MIGVNTKDISCDKGHTQPQRDGCKSEVGVLGERHLANMVRWNTGTSKDDQQKTSTQPMSPTSDLAVVRMRNTKDSAEEERETGGSGVIGITHDDVANETTPRRKGTLYGNILYMDGTSLHIKIVGEVLARDREEEGEPSDEQAIRNTGPP